MNLCESDYLHEDYAGSCRNSLVQYGLNSLCSCGARSVTWDFHGMTGCNKSSGIQGLVVPKKTVALRLKTQVSQSWFSASMTFISSFYQQSKTLSLSQRRCSLGALLVWWSHPSFASLASSLRQLDFSNHISCGEIALNLRICTVSCSHQKQAFWERIWKAKLIHVLNSRRGPNFSFKSTWLNKTVVPPDPRGSGNWRKA